MPNFSINIVAQPGETEREAVLAGLRAWNRQHAPAPGWLPLVLLLQDDERRLVGGLVGQSGWDWLHVELLWVADHVQRRGFARALMAHAEAEALARGCRGVHLDTHDFQAPGFYERLGYKQFGMLEDYPPGFRRHFMYKPLGA